MQVMATKGTEFGDFDGLGWIPGSVSQLASNQLPLPHIGWNNVQVDLQDPLFREMNAPEGVDFYFLHSFAFRPEDDRHAIASAEYGSRFASAVRKGNIYGVQFHPEKSQRAGQKLFKNFLDLT
jgi:glutamine amidotransferase